MFLVVSPRGHEFSFDARENLGFTISIVSLCTLCMANVIIIVDKTVNTDKSFAQISCNLSFGCASHLFNLVVHIL